MNRRNFLQAIGMTAITSATAHTRAQPKIKTIQERVITWINEHAKDIPVDDNDNAYIKVCESLCSLFNSPYYEDRQCAITRQTGKALDRVSLFFSGEYEDNAEDVVIDCEFDLIQQQFLRYAETTYINGEEQTITIN
jgi:hypothetical protein